MILTPFLAALVLTGALSTSPVAAEPPPCPADYVFTPGPYGLGCEITPRPGEPQPVGSQVPLMDLAVRLAAAGLDDGGMSSSVALLPDLSGVEIHWKGPLPAAAEPIIADARAAGTVVVVRDVPFTEPELTAAVGAIGDALRAAGIETWTTEFGTGSTVVTVGGPGLVDDVDLQEQAGLIAAQTVPGLTLAFVEAEQVTTFQATIPLPSASGPPRQPTRASAHAVVDVRSPRAV